MIQDFSLVQILSRVDVVQLHTVHDAERVAPRFPAGNLAEGFPEKVVGQLGKPFHVAQAGIHPVEAFRVLQHFVNGLTQQPVEAQSGLVRIYLAVHLVAAVHEVFQGAQAFLGNRKPHPGFRNVPAEPQVAQQVIEIETADGDRAVEAVPQHIIGPVGINFPRNYG